MASRVRSRQPALPTGSPTATVRARPVPTEAATARPAAGAQPGNGLGCSGRSGGAGELGHPRGEADPGDEPEHLGGPGG